MTRIRSKREAERLAHDEEQEREWQESLRIWRTTGPYHTIGVEPFATQWVCHLCSAIVLDTEPHTAWHASMGQEMPS